VLSLFLGMHDLACQLSCQYRPVVTDH
jgi:hypothetical protein